jgi:hypothetical protein
MRKSLVAAGLAAAVSLLTVAASAQAASPTLQVSAPVKASWVVGSPVSADYYTCDATGPIYTDALEALSWSATGSSASSGVTYDVVLHPWSEEDVPVLEHSVDTSVVSYGSNFNNSCGGGGGNPASWTVSATAGDGSTAERDVRGGLIAMTQDTGTDLSGSEGRVPSTTSVSYAGSWSTSSCGCWSGGTTHRTSAKRAAVTSTITVPDGEATHVGLVMAMGPDRGSAQVYVDGSLNTTVNTHSLTRQNRIVVWQRALGRGTHDVEVVNLATKGHPRIDFDGVLTN